MGAIDTRHPSYLEAQPDWRQLRDTYRGERVVKERGPLYLPLTSGMKADGATPEATANSKGWKDYVAYRTRARFPDVVREAVQSMLGIMHHRPPSIELPPQLEPLRERASVRGESLEVLLRAINEEQLVMGRVGLMLDLPKAPTQGPVLPYVATYKAEHVINWDAAGEGAELENLNLVVLDESGTTRQDVFEWRDVERHRVLVLGDPAENEPPGGGIYRQGVFVEHAEYSEEALTTPGIAGRTLNRIPFVFANTKDIVPEVDDAPLLGLSNLSLTIYRGEADYRQALFMQGQDTLVTIGATFQADDEVRTGAGARIDLPLGASAEFIGVHSEGLPEMREALVNDYARAEKASTALLEAVSKAAESGEALRVRVAARTSSLTTVAQAGAYALQELLRIAAVWVGANPLEVVVEPNLDFVSESVEGRTLVDLQTAKSLGAPLSQRSIHENVIQRRGLSVLSFDDEVKEMQAEAEKGIPGATPPAEDDGGSTSEDGPMAGKPAGGAAPKGDDEDDDDEGG